MWRVWVVRMMRVVRVVAMRSGAVRVMTMRVVGVVSMGIVPVWRWRRGRWWRRGGSLRR